MNLLPGADEIADLHRKYAPTQEAFDLVYTHCRIVCEIAEQLMGRPGVADRVDPALVRAGCLLHDIGVYRLYGPDGRLDEANYIRHGVLGHETLRAEGFDERLCRFASCHTGVGITKEDIVARRLPLPPEDYVARTADERLVMYADKFHSKSEPPKFLSCSAYRRQVRRFGEDKVARFDELAREFGQPDLSCLVSIYGFDLVD